MTQVSALKWGLFRPRLVYPAGPYHELLRRSAERVPDKPALIFRGQTFTFRELESMSNSLAHALLDLGVRKGERLGVFLGNSPEFVIAFYAISKAGGVITPLNPYMQAREARYQLTDSGAAALVAEAGLLPLVEEIVADLPALRHIIVTGADGAHTRAGDVPVMPFAGLVAAYPPHPPPEVALDPAEDLLALPYSSGTTGLAKGVMLTHRNLVCNNIQFTSAGRVTAADTLLIFLPYYHIYGCMLMGGAVAAGATQVLMGRFQVEEALALVEKYRVTLFYAVPPVLLALSQYSRLAQHDLSSIRYIKSGAAPLAPEVQRRVTELTGVTVLMGYGLTEASPLTHLTPVDDPALVKPGSVGRPVPDEEQKVVDIETGLREMPPGEAGELVVRGPHVMKGYWNEPGETARALRDGWLYTGDIVRVDEDGYVFIVDRKKEMIKYKGFGIPPAELEAVLFEHPAVADCAVVGVPDAEAGEVPKAFVVLRDGVRVSPEELMAHVAGRVAGYKQVRQVEFVEAIPKNPAGKVLRRVLREGECRGPAVTATGS